MYASRYYGGMPEEKYTLPSVPLVHSAKAIQGSSSAAWHLSNNEPNNTESRPQGTRSWKKTKMALSRGAAALVAPKDTLKKKKKFSQYSYSRNGTQAATETPKVPGDGERNYSIPARPAYR